MGRDDRVIDPEGIYHAVTKGNNGEPIVRDDVDREAWRSRLDHVAETHDWEIYAWCLLDNHYHVVLGAPKGGFSEGFQLLNGGHSRQFNARHGRYGHLVRNRFFSRPILTDEHLVTAIVYVARNPVKAGICRRPGSWPYGGYRATVGDERAPAWLVLDRVLPLFGDTPNAARHAYAGQVTGGPDPVSDTVTEVRRFLGELPPKSRMLLAATSG